MTPAVPVTGEIRRLGRSTWHFPRRPRFLAVGTVAGPFEGRGPLGSLFDTVTRDELLGKKSWEQAESELALQAFSRALSKARLTPQDLDILLAGDLLNQLGASVFFARDQDLPFLGLFGACSTWAEGLALAGALLDGGYAQRVAVVTSSHHHSAERQFRYPTEFAVQRPPTATWTATGAGAAILEEGDSGSGGPAPAVVLTHATVGRVVDTGLKDPYDLGSAMAPAAADCLETHFRETGRSPLDYDLVATGDLGEVGSPLLQDLLLARGINLAPVHQDCGLLLYRQDQDVHAGGSGCACSALVFSARFYPELLGGKMKRMLIVATGALFSQTSYLQGESIPCIAYAVALERV